MTQDNRLDRPPRLISGAVIFAGFQAIAAFGLYWTTLAPDYRGGAFLQVLLIILGVLSVLAAYSEIAAGRSPRPRPTETEPNAGVGLPVLTAIVCGVVIVIGVAGLYLGSTLLLFGYWLGVVGVRPIKAALLAALFGAAMPILFSTLIGTRLWPGAMPTIVRHYIGGGTLPPL